VVNIVGGDMSSNSGLINAYGKTPPSKGSFSDFRRTVGFAFCKNIFEQQVEGFDSFRPKWKGYHVFAVDGDQYQLPACGDALEKGYRGAPVQGDRETYYPRMYVSYVYDVLSGTIVDFAESTENQELERALGFIDKSSSNSLILYDRLYFCTDLVATHGTNDSYFVCRLKTGDKCLKVIKEFLKSKKRNDVVSIEGYEVHLIKVKNPNSGEDLYFATNLPRSKFRNKEISELYTRRWDIETGFRDLSKTMKLENWHTHYTNGILQEIYAGLWIYNQIKKAEYKVLETKGRKRLSRVYWRLCFKSLLMWFVKWFKNLGKVAGICLDEFKTLVKTTLEKRTRLKRSYPRVSKQPASKHSSEALVERRS